MSSDDPKIKLVTSGAINMVVEVNETIVDNARRGTDAELTIPSLFERAYMVFYETGLMPIADWEER